MEWKMMSIEAYFEKAVNARRLSDETCPGADYCDQEQNTFILLRDFEKTVNFLQNADKAVIACAVDSLEDIVRALSKEKATVILNIFEEKLETFPDLVDLSSSDYIDELTLAKEIVFDKL